jgi:assimilatory nitrate reductase electron transfer subunit
MSRRVVVVGYGMAGARLAEEVRRRDPEGRHVELTVLGAEPHPAYNRVLLSAVVAGSVERDAVRMHAPDWSRRHRVDLRLRTRVRRLDRRRGRVEAAGGPARYDAVVLATGSRPWIPPTAGLVTEDGALAPGVQEFRTVEDCERLLRAGESGVPVAILGGGLLGLETAWALAGHGNQVTVVHPLDHLMERQLDKGAAGMLARMLTDAGVLLRLDRKAVRYTGAGLELDDGSTVDAGLVLVCAGVRPEVDLARAAGLTVGAGIVVDDSLRTSDPRVYAIGDCAEHAGSVAGQVQPAWEQAAVLADLLTGADAAARYTGTAAVTRLKARGVELAAMGEVHVDSGAEVLRLEDPTSRRYAKLVLRGDTVTGAVVLGMPDTAATIAQHFDLGIPAPADRLGLLLGRGAGPAAPAPADMPAGTVVCRCNTVTKSQLVTAHRAGAGDLPALVATTRATTGCGSCTNTVRALAGWLAASTP